MYYSNLKEQAYLQYLEESCGKGSKKKRKKPAKVSEGSVVLNESSMMYPWIITTLILRVIMLLIELLVVIPSMLKGSTRSKVLEERVRDILNDPDTEVYIIPTKAPNAFNMGGNKLYYTQGLARLITEDEMVGVLLHEYGHYEGKHVYKNMIVSIGGGLIVDAIGALAPAYVDMIVWMLGHIGLQVLVIAMGRRFENQSDSFAAKHGYKKELIGALVKLDKWMRVQLCGAKASESKDCRAMVDAMHEGDVHPKLADRVKNILDSVVLKPLAAIGKLVSLPAMLKIFRMVSGKLSGVITTGSTEEVAPDTLAEAFRYCSEK